MSSERVTEPGLRLDPAVGLTILGWTCIVGGGLVAAVTGPLDVPRGSWLAAYLVLVAGVAQCAMGQDRSTYSSNSSAREGWLQLAAWNLGNAAVVVGTLAGVPPLVYVGSALLVCALVLAWRAGRAGAALAAGSGSRSDRAWRWGYPTLLVVLAVSIPVGMVLSAVRNS